METTCVACNVKSYGMIGIFRHPKKLDEMFTELSGFEVLLDDYLCIQCYEDLKSALEFKRKIENNCHKSIRKRIIKIPDDEPVIEHIDTGDGGGEYEVLISSTSEQDALAQQSTFDTKKGPKTLRKSPRKVSLQKITDTKDIELILSCDNFESEEPSFKLFEPSDETEAEYIEEEIEVEEKTSNKEKTVVKSNKCQYCTKTFRSKQALESHHRSHTGSKPFICDYCKKGFAEMGNLRQHISSIHLDQRKYSCEKCKKAFKTHYSHKVHIRMCITKEKPFRCQYCEKGFYSSGKLLIHTRTHTNERPYPCPHCNSKFKDSTGLKRHVGRIHQAKPVKSEIIMHDDEENSQ